MSDKDRQIVRKIIKYINETVSYIHALNYQDFIQDSKTVSATAFVIGQIGELTKRLSDETERAYPQIYWKGIRGMRNKIVHDYENVDLSILWDTISNDLPELLKQLNRILQDN